MEQKFFTLSVLSYNGLTYNEQTIQLKHDYLALLPGGLLRLTNAAFALFVEEDKLSDSNWYHPISKDTTTGVLLQFRPGTCITITSQRPFGSQKVAMSAQHSFILYNGYVWTPQKTPTDFPYWESRGIPGKMPWEIFKALNTGPLILTF